MCGIYAVCFSAEKKFGQSKQNAGEVVLAGLKRLEYRGYDSWGVAVGGVPLVIADSDPQSMHGSRVKPGMTDKIMVEKHVGKIGGVAKTGLPAAHVALGHTRWATHGGVTQVNAHPHLATHGEFALAQNGVMENYQEQKAALQAKGYQFISQTDTEVIVRLVEEMTARRSRAMRPGRGGSSVDRPQAEFAKPPTFADFFAAFNELQGRNTVAALTQTGELLALRDGSPLVVARDTAGNTYLSSDVVSVAADAQEFYPLETGEGVAVSAAGVTLYSAAGVAQPQVPWQKIEVESLQLDKGGFAHFMRKEIQEQSQVLQKPLAQPLAKFADLIDRLRQARRVYTVGAGSADFVGQQLAFWWRMHGIVATSIKAYEARSFFPQCGAGDVAVFVSQSGETADTIAVADEMKRRGVFIVSLVNMPGSSLTRLADLPFMLQIGPEIGIASTKAVTSMIAWGWGVAQQLGGRSLEDCTQAVAAYQNELALWLADETVHRQLQDVITVLQPKQHAFVLGRGQLAAVALEFALKLKEICYIHTEGFASGELKHGVIALIEEGTPVFCLIADDEDQADLLSAAAEVKARGAHVIGVAAKHNQLFDSWLSVPENTDLAAISAIIPSQLLAYELALALKLDPDKPRNLAKSVTVK